MHVTPTLVQAADAVLGGALEPLAMLNLDQDLCCPSQASLLAKSCMYERSSQMGFCRGSAGLKSYAVPQHMISTVTRT